MIVKLTEVSKSDKVSDIGKLNTMGEYFLREIFVNPDHVVCLREDKVFSRKLEEGNLGEILDKRQSFTRVYMNRGQSGLDVVVVGSPSIVQEKLGLNLNKKELLKG